MFRSVLVGLDGSSESRAAAEWAAREAKLRGLPLRLVHVWEPVPEPMAQAPLLGAETQQHWSERIPRETAEGLQSRHPGVDVTAVHLNGRPGDVLVDVARDAELLVLGSRGLSGVGGFMVGSVGQAVIARTEAPVVLVRSGEQAADEHTMDPAGIPSAATSFRPVLLGLDIRSPDDTVIAFAFEEAARRRTALRVLHAWSPPPYNIYGLSDHVSVYDELAREKAAELTDALRPWRQKHPAVEVIEASRAGSAADQIANSSRNASLVVVGRRIRRSRFGAHIGPVAHAVLHHAVAPVAVVAHA
ncbi:stress-inducible protein [Streptomyces viridochromogenes DSM 40736]|uniref:Stress-inducible protein n=1 Tax=Streptomyces viridochromogenes (strain DSM 40736 / JCM 4977 / BCRC 1201 / Tue 494) TaxID=591159 RepID=D9X7L6_STRVT|nr:universal stress protein [Streptomyces viridochromogenes]EFL29912.1 stress-inducible protein [Streptomyces viridochromogenes DSM 40736]